MTEYKEKRIAQLQYPSWITYQEVFKQSAKILGSNLKNIGEYNTLVFPIIYLTRHYVELSLKLIIITARYIENNANSLGIPPKHHDLSKLWEEAKGHIKKVKSIYEEPIPKGVAIEMGLFEDPKSELTIIETLIKKLHDIDPSSLGTRYPVIEDKTLKIYQPSFKGKPEILDLDELISDFNQIARYLDWAVSQFPIFQDEHDDLEAEIRRELGKPEDYY